MENDKYVLLAVDLQRDFIDGALGSARAQAIVPGAAARIERAKADPDCALILYTRDTHGGDYLRTQEGCKLPVPHCLRGTPGWELCEAVARALAGCEKALAVDKSTFGAPDLWRLIPAGVGRVEIIGLCTDICVIANAVLLRTHLPEVEICVDASLCAGATEAGHETALAAMRHLQISARFAR